MTHRMAVRLFCGTRFARRPEPPSMPFVAVARRRCRRRRIIVDDAAAGAISCPLPFAAVMGNATTVAAGGMNDSPAGMISGSSNADKSSRRGNDDGAIMVVTWNSCQFFFICRVPL
jgi:hypothetical protein